jgi:hypothetical protein
VCLWFPSVPSTNSDYSSNQLQAVAFHNVDAVCFLWNRRLIFHVTWRHLMLHIFKRLNALALIFCHFRYAHSLRNWDFCLSLARVLIPLTFQRIESFRISRGTCLPLGLIMGSPSHVRRSVRCLSILRRCIDCLTPYCGLSAYSSVQTDWSHQTFRRNQLPSYSREHVP